jgi:hypothetical protein
VWGLGFRVSEFRGFGFRGSGFRLGVAGLGETQTARPEQSYMLLGARPRHQRLHCIRLQLRLVHLRWVWGLGVGVWGLGFGVWGLGFGVWFRVGG